MSREALLSLLAGPQVSGVATAVTWVPDDVLLQLADGSDPAEALSSFARSCGVDGAFVDGGSPERVASALRHSGIASLWVIDGIFGRVAEAHGWQAAIKMSASPSAELSTYLDRALLDASQDIAIARAAGADALVIADDIAGSVHPLVSPDFAVEELAGRYATLVAPWAASGSAVVFHSDGDLSAALTWLVDAGFSAVHFGLLGHEMLVESFKHALELGLCPVGGITASATLDPQHVAALIGDGPAVLADDGGVASIDEALRLRDAFARVRLALEPGRSG